MNVKVMYDSKTKKNLLNYRFFEKLVKMSKEKIFWIDFNFINISLKNTKKTENYLKFNVRDDEI